MKRHQIFFDGEEGMYSTSSSDGLYGSTHLAELWEDTEYDATAEGDFCQTEKANLVDRMDVLFLMDLIGTPGPDFQEFIVKRY